MCRPASFVLTRDAVYWSRNSDSHEDIIEEHGLPDNVLPPEILRVELLPPDDWAASPARWTWNVDQDEKPGWYNPAHDEARGRAALPAWLEAKAILSGTRQVSSGLVYVVGSARAVLLDSASAELYGSASAELYDSATAIKYGRMASAVLAQKSLSVCIDRSMPGTVTLSTAPSE